MKTCVLRDMAPIEVRQRLEQFAASYVADWEEWLDVAESKRVSKFASILRSWQATRPLPMRRPTAEASHEPPYIEQLIDEAEPHLKNLGNLCVSDLVLATPDQINALHGLWTTFSKLSQKGSASCVGITKAILLLTNGRIGPAFDSMVRKQLGLRDHLRSSEEWVEALRGIAEDIFAFEQQHGKLATIVPDRFKGYEVGRLYDMVLGPGTSPSPALTEPSRQSVVRPFEQLPAV
jgi:hypothetical protein